MGEYNLSVNRDQYREAPPSTGRNLQRLFSVKEETLDSLKAQRQQMIAARAAEDDGRVVDPAQWAKLDPKLRHAAVGLLLADVFNGRDLRKARYPIPSVRATLTIDTGEMVQLFQEAISVLAAPMKFGEMLLRKVIHPSNSGAYEGRAASAVAEDYIFEQKLSGQGYKDVSSMWEYATYTIKQRGIKVSIDRWDLNKLPWDELGRQLQLIANGAARTINWLCYKAFFDAYGAGVRPFPDLENIGGTGASALPTIDASDTTPYTGVARTDGVIIYDDYIYSRRRIMSRPNAIDMKYIVVAPVQWEHIEKWNVSQKIAFAQVVGRSGQTFQTLPGYDGRIIPVTLIVDDDIADSQFQVSSKNIALFVGSSEYVGVYAVDEEPSIFQGYKDETNVDYIIGRMANAAVISNYNSWVFEYNLAIS